VNQARGNKARGNEAYWCMIMPLFRAACHPSVLFSVYLLGPQAKPHFTPRDNKVLHSGHSFFLHSIRKYIDAFYKAEF
jgi:hypothetical protein